MKRLDTWIDYMKLVIIINLFLLGSMEPEPNIVVLAFLISVLILSMAAELILVMTRARLQEKYDKYISVLERTVKEQLQEGNRAA